MMRNVNTPENTTSLKKCAPPESRNAPAAAPNSSAAPYAIARHAGGARAAGASVQNPPAPSPATNEQFLSHSPRGSHHGTNFSGPLNSVTSAGRGRPQ